MVTSTFGPSPHIALFHEALPRYDCGGADLRLFELARELQSLGCRVTFVARDNRNEKRYRPPLEALGVQVYAGDRQWIDCDGGSWDLKDVLQAEGFEIAILALWFWHGISLPEQYLDEIRRHSPMTRVLILSDDRHGERERQCARLSGLLSDIERGNDFEQREAEIYERADLVLYVAETDRRRFLELVPQLSTEHLPTSVELLHGGPGYAPREGVLLFGNFENPANQDGLEWFLREVWPLARGAAPELRLYVAGYAAPQGLERQHPAVVSVGRVDELGTLFDKHRVMATPVRYGTGVVTKNMQALAHGLPVVTTSVGAEGLQLKNEIHALLGDAPREFAANLVRMHGDQAIWERLSVEGRCFIREKFCVENVRRQIGKIVSRSFDLQPRPWEPNHQWSYREVESAFPEFLSPELASYRQILRNLAYWQLGRQYLEAGQYAGALHQLRHVFTSVRGPLGASVFQIALLNDLACCYAGLGDLEMVGRCRREARECMRTWPAHAPFSHSVKEIHPGGNGSA